jgi:LemA protein
MSTAVASNSAPGGSGRGILFVIGIVLLLVAVAIGAVILWAVGVNNGLVSKQEDVKKAWSQVETVLQRRFDLIPNLVNTVKGYAAHEASVLEEVTRLRSQWGEAKTVDEKAETASKLEGMLSRLMVISENYPQLKADQQFRDLQVELSGTENRVVVERQRYNEVVRDYNTSVRQFPGSLVAGMRGFKTDFKYFEAEKPAESAPKVDFSTK